MSSLVIQLDRYDRQGDLVTLVWEINGLVYERTVFYSEIDTRDKAMVWLSQQLAIIPDPAPFPVGKYTLTIDDATGAVTNIARDTTVDDLLALIAQRKTQITTDLAALPAATNADMKNIIGRQLQSESKSLDGLAGILRYLQRIG